MECKDCVFSYKENLFLNDFCCALRRIDEKMPNNLYKECSKTDEEIKDIKDILDYFKVKDIKLKG